MTRPLPGPSIGRKALFSGATLLLLLLLAEVLSWILLVVVEGGVLGPEERAREREALRDPASAWTEDEGAIPRWVLRDRERQALHPYVGFVVDPSNEPRARSPRFHPDARRTGFPFNVHPLFNERASGRLIVAIVGGSVAQQIGLRTSYLEQSLRGVWRWRDREVVALNLGLSGGKQPQQLAAVAYLLAQGWSVDVLINVDGFNEVTLPIKDNVSWGVNPFYPRNWRFRVGQPSQAQLDIRGEITALQSLRARWGGALSGPVVGRARSAALLWRVGDRLLLRAIRAREERLSTLVAAGEADFQLVGPPTSFASEEELAVGLVDLWRRSSLQLHHLALGNGFEYHHFLQPNQYVPGSKELTAEERRTAFQADSPFASLVPDGYERLRTAGGSLRASGVAFHDLSGLFREVTETVYVDTCCHFNREGVEMLIDAIVAALEETPDSGVGERR